MEKYVSTCRLILCANSTSRVLPAIKSRCLAIRIPAPTHEEVKNILHLVSRKESLTLPDELAEKIAKASGRNLRRAILMLEACKVEQYPFEANQKVSEPDWQIYIRGIAKLMIAEQSPRKLLEIRNRLYELLTHAIPTDLIFRGLLQESIRDCDINLQMQISVLAAEYEHRMHSGSKVIFHLEAFIARFMAIYKKFIDSVAMEF